MTEQVYQTLAQTLDALPHGYPATDTGAELRLLEKMFTPEEAALGSILQPRLEPVDAIAERAGLDPDTALTALKGMTAKGLIRYRKKDDLHLFSLMPFVIGFYEAQLPHMDEELAALVEQYFLDSGGALVRPAPSVHRVIPVGESIPSGMQVYPYEQASYLLETAKDWGVRDCICRTQKKLIDQACEHPIENCLVFAPVENYFVTSKIDRAITKEEAFKILDEAAQAGLVHSPGNYQDGNTYICNCCSCSCGIMRGVTEFDIPTAVARSNFLMTVDEEICNGCLDCLDRCQFDAISIPDLMCEIDLARCMGCGSCSLVCGVDALILARRPDAETLLPPITEKEWIAQRVDARGM